MGRQTLSVFQNTDQKANVPPLIDNSTASLMAKIMSTLVPQKLLNRLDIPGRKSVVKNS